MDLQVGSPVQAYIITPSQTYFSIFIKAIKY